MKNNRPVRSQKKSLCQSYSELNAIFVLKTITLSSQTKKMCTYSTFFGKLGVPLGRASGEKCFLNPRGFRKFFECFPNHYAKDFVGVGEIRTGNLHRI